MDNRQYMIVVHPLSEEDGGGFIAFSPDLPGCLGDGETRETAVAEFEKAVNEWIDEAVRLDRPIPDAGDFARQAVAEHKKIGDLLKAQEELIKQQEQLLKAQGEDLKQTKKEIERIKASMVLGREHVPYQLRGESYGVWQLLEAMPPHIAGAVARRRLHGKRLN